MRVLFYRSMYLVTRWLWLRGAVKSTAVTPWIKRWAREKARRRTMKIKREDFEREFSSFAPGTTGERLERHLNNLGIEIEDPEPEVVLEFGEWYRLASDGSVQYRTPSNAWVRCELDENHLAKIAEEVTRLARDIQRKDEALRLASIVLGPISEKACHHAEIDHCLPCIAARALQAI